MVKKVDGTGVHEGFGNYEKKYTGKMLTVKLAHKVAIEHLNECVKTQVSIGALGARNESQSSPKFEHLTKKPKKDDLYSIEIKRRIH